MYFIFLCFSIFDRVQSFIILGDLIGKINTVMLVVYYAVAMCAHPNNAACSTTFASSEPYYMPIK